MKIAEKRDRGSVHGNWVNAKKRTASRQVIETEPEKTHAPKREKPVSPRLTPSRTAMP